MLHGATVGVKKSIPVITGKLLCTSTVNSNQLCYFSNDHTGVSINDFGTFSFRNEILKTS